jgi:hypothetical protein
MELHDKMLKRRRFIILSVCVIFIPLLIFIFFVFSRRFPLYIAYIIVLFFSGFFILEILFEFIRNDLTITDNYIEYPNSFMELLFAKGKWIVKMNFTDILDKGIDKYYICLSNHKYKLTIQRRFLDNDQLVIKELRRLIQ